VKEFKPAPVQLDTAPEHGRSYLVIDINEYDEMRWGLEIDDEAEEDHGAAILLLVDRLVAEGLL